MKWAVDIARQPGSGVLVCFRASPFLGRPGRHDYWLTGEMVASSLTPRNFQRTCIPCKWCCGGAPGDVVPSLRLRRKVLCSSLLLSYGTDRTTGAESCGRMIARYFRQQWRLEHSSCVCSSASLLEDNPDPFLFADPQRLLRLPTPRSGGVFSAVCQRKAYSSLVRVGCVSRDTSDQWSAQLQRMSGIVVPGMKIVIRNKRGNLFHTCSPMRGARTCTVSIRILRAVIAVCEGTIVTEQYQPRYWRGQRHH